MLPQTFIQEITCSSYWSFHIVRKLGPNACYLELPSDLKFSQIYNVAVLFLYQSTFEPPIMHVGFSTVCTTFSVPFSVLPLLPSSSLDYIECIITNEIVSSAHGGFQRFLVKW